MIAVTYPGGQKTWTDLLGKPTDKDSVEDNLIVRETELHRFKILWSFDTNEMANAVYNSWIKENN